VAPFGADNVSIGEESLLLESQSCVAGWLWILQLNSFPVASAWLPPAGRETPGLHTQTTMLQGQGSLQGLGQNPPTSCQIVITPSGHEAGV
jgi:hypothetical protein